MVDWLNSVGGMVTAAITVMVFLGTGCAAMGVLFHRVRNLEERTKHIPKIFEALAVIKTDVKWLVTAQTEHNRGHEE